MKWKGTSMWMSAAEDMCAWPDTMGAVTDAETSSATRARGFHLPGMPCVTATAC